MREFVIVLLFTAPSLLFMWWADAYYNAKDLRRKIEKLAVEHYSEFMSALNKMSFAWSYSFNAASWQGDMILRMGVDLTTGKYNTLHLFYLPKKGSIRKSAKRLIELTRMNINSLEE